MSSNVKTITVDPAPIPAVPSEGLGPRASGNIPPSPPKPLPEPTEGGSYSRPRSLRPLENYRFRAQRRQDRPKTLPRALQERPRELPDRPRPPQDHSKTTQDSSQIAQGSDLVQKRYFPLNYLSLSLSIYIYIYIYINNDESTFLAPRRVPKQPGSAQRSPQDNARSPKLAPRAAKIAQDRLKKRPRSP